VKDCPLSGWSADELNAFRCLPREMLVPGEKPMRAGDWKRLFARLFLSNLVLIGVVVVLVLMHACE